MNIFIKIIALLTGIYLFVGSIADNDHLLSGRREKMLTKVIGRLGVRIFYTFSGALVIIIIILNFAGILIF